MVTALGNMSTQIAKPHAEALLAEERLEREKLAWDKTMLETTEEALRVLV